jgi:hypothetical protein
MASSESMARASSFHKSRSSGSAQRQFADGGARVLRSSRHQTKNHPQSPRPQRAERRLGRHATPYTGLTQPASTLTSDEQTTERSVLHGAGWPATLCRAVVDDLSWYQCTTTLRAGKPYGKPIFGVGFDLIKNLRKNLRETYF